MTKHLKQVMEFQDTFDKTYGLNKEPLIPNEEVIDLRIKLLTEEIQELAKAFYKNDMVGVADALTDIQYILDGTILHCGLQDKMEALSDEVHRSNMSKLDENGNVIYRKDGKILKSNMYSKPNLQEILFPNSTISMATIADEIETEALAENHTVGTIDTEQLMAGIKDVMIEDTGFKIVAKDTWDENINSKKWKPINELEAQVEKELQVVYFRTIQINDNLSENIYAVVDTSIV